MLTVTLMLATLGAPGGKVAVLDLGTPGIAPDHGKALSQNLVGVIASEVAELGYTVISSADIAAMLSYEKQKDLLGCEDNAVCLAEIGGALGADLLVSGTLGQLGGALNLTLTLLDIQRGEVKRRFQASVGSEGALAASAKRGVATLFEQKVDAAGTGTIYVKTEPDGAVVLLDGKEVGRGPLTIDEVATGEHELVAKGDSGEGRAVVRVKAGAVARVTLAVVGKPVALKVISTPGEAHVLIDGRDVGVTPLVLSDVAAGTHTVRLELEDHLPAEERLTLSYDDFQQSGGMPFKIERTMTRRLRFLPVPVGIAVSGLVDAKERDDSLASMAELFIQPASWLEIALGAGQPIFSGLTLRLWLVHAAGLEIGLHARAILFLRQPARDVGPPATSGGLSLAYAYATRAGDFGVRLEPSASRDLRMGVTTFPLSASVFWRL